MLLNSFQELRIGGLWPARHVSASIVPDKQEEGTEQNREDDQHDEHGSRELGVVCHCQKQVLPRELGV